jgi:hypothetical protein
MARTALPVLELDDPLRERPPTIQDPGPPPPAAAATAAAEKPAAQPRPRRRAPAKPAASPPWRPAGAPDASANTGEQPALWREWGRGSRTATYRLPEDLLSELDARARALDLPLGMTVAAAVLGLLDGTDDEVVAAVERAEDARLHASRRARRPAQSPS